MKSQRVGVFRLLVEAATDRHRDHVGYGPAPGGQFLKRGSRGMHARDRLGVRGEHGGQTEGVVTEHRPGGGSGRGGDRTGSPLDSEQRVGVVTARLGTGFRTCGTQRQRLHGDNGLAPRVDRRDPHRVLTARGDPHPQGARPFRVQGHALPGEREQAAVVALGGQEDRAVQGGVEERRVQTESVGVLDRVGQCDLGVDRVVLAPHGTQSTEDRTVLQTVGGVALEHALDVDGLRVTRRPHGGVEADDLLTGPDAAGGVLGPFGVEVLAGPGEEPQFARAVLVGGADGDLHLHGTRGGEYQRRGDHQLLDPVAAGLVGGADGQLQEAGTGEEDHAADDVVGEPRMGGGRQGAGQQEFAGTGHRHGGTEQRVVGRGQTEAGGVQGGRGRLGPVTLVLEGVGGQFGDAGAGAGQRGRPVDVDTGDMQSGDAAEDGHGLVAVLAQRRHDDRAGVGQGGGGERREHSVGTDLQEGGDTPAGERADTVGEPHGLTDMTHPVAGLGVRARGGDLARQVGHDRDPRLVVRERLRDRTELLQHRVHQRRVERVAHPKAAGTATPRGKLLRDRESGLLLAGDDDGGRTVDRRHGDTLGEQRQHLVLGRLHCHHGTATRQRLHQTSTRRDQPAGVLQREHPGDVGGGDLTDRVTGHEVRGDTPGLQQTVEGDLDREERGLGERGGVQGGFVGAPHHVADGCALPGLQESGDGVERFGEHREAGVEFTAHAEALGTLPGEQEGGTARFGDATGDLGEGAVGGEQDRPVLEVGAAGGQGVRGVERGQRVGGLPQPLHLGVERGPGLRRDGPGERAGHRTVGSRHGHRLIGGALENDVGVGAADAERRHTGPTRPSRLRPVGLLGEQPHRTQRPVDVRGRLGDVQRAREHTLPYRHDHLDEPGGTGRGLGVADVGLHRAEQQRLLRVPVAAVGGEQGLRLDRVAERGAGAVRLDGVDIAGPQTRVGQRLPDHPLLGGAVGGREAVGGAVLVDGGAAHDGEHAVSGTAGVGETLDDEDRRALGPAGAVGGVGERLAAAVLGQSAHPGEPGEVGRGGHHGDTTHQRHAALTRPQRLRGEMQGHQRRGAGRVDGQGGALQAECVGEAAGDHADGQTGGGVAGDVVAGPHDQTGVVLAVDSHEDTRAASAQGGRVDTGALDGLPGDFEQDALLRVHGQGLARRDTEEPGVEAGDVAQESALSGHRTGLTADEPRRLPLTVGGEAGDGVGSGRQEVPQFLGRPDTAREAAAHPDDDDRIVRHVGGAFRGGEDLDGVGAQQFVQEMVGELLGRRVVEDERGGQSETRCLAEPVAQLDRGERVEAETAELAAGVDGVGGTVAQNRGCLGTHQVDDERPPLLLGQNGETLGESGSGDRGGGRPGPAPTGADESAQDRGDADTGGQRATAAQTERHHERFAGEHGGVVQGQAPLDGQQRHPTGVTDPAGVLATQPAGHADALFPGAPGERGGGQAEGLTVGGEGVQEGVARRVVGLPGAAHDTGRRGVQDEGGQVEVTGEVVQVPGGVDLRPQYGVEAVGGEGGDDAVVEDTRRVHHRGQRVLGRDGGEQRGEGVAVGDVTGGDPGLGTQVGQRLDEV